MVADDHPIVARTRVARGPGRGRVRPVVATAGRTARESGSAGGGATRPAGSWVLDMQMPAALSGAEVTAPAGGGRPGLSRVLVLFGPAAEHDDVPPGV